MNTTFSKSPKISIGLFVYNGEKFICKRIDSILEQTFTDFELIISDNASTDTTSDICKEYARKDNRIRYIRHEKNMGQIWNFLFVLKEAKHEYFMWAAVDDIILPEFIENNLSILISKKGVIGCISKVKPYEIDADNSKLDVIDTRFKNFRQKLSQSLKSIDIHPINGLYEKKVGKYLRNSSCQLIYGVFQTDVLQNSLIQNHFVGNEWSIMLNVLKEGDFEVVDKVLMYRYGGLSETGIINIASRFNENFFGIIFPYYPFTSWCARNLGISIFLKNLDYFIQLNIEGGFVVFLDLIRLLTHKIMKK